MSSSTSDFDMIYQNVVILYIPNLNIAFVAIIILGVLSDYLFLNTYF